MQVNLSCLWERLPGLNTCQQNDISTAVLNHSPNVLEFLREVAMDSTHPYPTQQLAAVLRGLLLAREKESS